MHTVSQEQFVGVFPGMSQETHEFMSAMSQAVASHTSGLYAYDAETHDHMAKNDMAAVGMVLPLGHSETGSPVQYEIGFDGEFKIGQVSFSGLRIAAGSLDYAYPENMQDIRLAWFGLSQEPLFTISEQYGRTNVTAHAADLLIGEDEIITWAKRHALRAGSNQPITPVNLDMFRDDAMVLCGRLGIPVTTPSV